MSRGNLIPVIALILTFSSIEVCSQERFIDRLGQLNYENLDNWYSRPVKESFLIGGETIRLFQIGEVSCSDWKSATVGCESPWGTSNLHAKIGIDLASACVFPEKRDNGFCCRMETTIRGIHVLGMAIDALVTGAIFVGEFLEPVRSIKAPIKKMNHGIPFTRRPRAVKFDYKCIPGKERINTDKHGILVPGQDKAEFCFILQKRWEEADGNVFAVRIGGVRAFFDDTRNQWINGATFPVRYGDITQEPTFDPQTMGLIPSVGPMYVRNSKGAMVPLVEQRWGKSDEAPTHLVMYFNSSYQGIDFIGSPESKFWVDNISLIY